MREKDMKKMFDTTMLGAMTVQSTELLTRPRTTANLTGTATGMVGIGVTAGIGSVAWKMVTEPMKQVRKKRR